MDVGKQYGRWTVVGGRDRRKVPCQCACGTERLVDVGNLTAGLTRSCGCLKREATAARSRTHGTGYEDYRYRVWKTIKGKCLRSSHQDFAYYGGRGIAMYPAWISDYSAFAQYIDTELGPRPEGYTLDRIDNSGDYVPGNLRWASRSQQALNRRSRWRNREAE